MTNQLTAQQPIEVIASSDFDQDFVFLLNGLPFDFTGLTEVSLSLIQIDNKTLKTFLYSAGAITLPSAGNLVKGILHLHINAIDTNTIKRSAGKNLDFVCTGPWGVRTFRAKATLSIIDASVGA